MTSVGFELVKQQLVIMYYVSAAIIRGVVESSIPPSIMYRQG